MDGHQDITIKWIAHGITYSGEIAVIVFFFVSGAVVSGSLLNSSPTSFLFKRITRLLPGLLICLIFTSLITISLFPSIGILNPLKYVVLNILNTFNVGQLPNMGGLSLFEIPGAFVDHNYKAVNGSLWTLPQEFRLYFVIVFASLFSSKFGKRQVLGTNIFLLFLLIHSPSLVPLIGEDVAMLGNKDAVINSIFFIVGSLFYIIEMDRLKSYVLAIFGIIIYISWLNMQNHHLIFFLAIVFLTTSASKFRLLTKINLPGDYSYGIYLYGWPSGQILFFFYPTLSPELACIYTIFIALALAVPSWHFIEKPCLQFVKKKLKQVNRGD
jgi:peptidoglycan/LPS O-acetylase OafA/YrhL